MDCPVTDSDIEFYRQNGFMQYKRFFSSEEMDRLRDVIDRAIATHRDRILGAEKGGRVSDNYERVFN